MNRSFTSLGGDSITAMQFISQCRAAGMTVGTARRSQQDNDGTAGGLDPVRGAAAFEEEHVRSHQHGVRLSPAQQLFFEMGGRDHLHHGVESAASDAGEPDRLTSSARFHQSFLLRLSRPVSKIDMSLAIKRLVNRHSMLRARYRRTDRGVWTQSIAADTSSASPVYSFRADDAESSELVGKAAALAQGEINMQVGPVFSAVFFHNNVDGKGPALFLVAHHLVIDLVSWRIIIGDLEDALIKGIMPVEAPFPFQAWVQQQLEHSKQALSPDRALPTGITTANLDYWGMNGVRNVYGDTREEKFSLDETSTANLITRSHDALGTDMVDVLLASLLHSFGHVFDDRDIPTVFVEGHGREPWDASIDLSSTVGWFTSIAPTHVPIQPYQSIIRAIMQSKDTRRRIPSNGYEYMASRYLHEQGRAKFGNYGTAEIVFNYMGLYQQLEKADGLFSLLDIELTPSASNVGPETSRWSLIELSAGVVGGCPRDIDQLQLQDEAR